MLLLIPVSAVLSAFFLRSLGLGSMSDLPHWSAGRRCCRTVEEMGTQGRRVRFRFRNLGEFFLCDP